MGVLSLRVAEEKPGATFLCRRHLMTCGEWWWGVLGAVPGGWWWPHTWTDTTLSRFLGLPWAHQAAADRISGWEPSQNLPGEVPRTGHLGVSGWGFQWLFPNLLATTLLPLTLRFFPHLCKPNSYTKLTYVKWLCFPIYTQADTAGI